MKNKKHKRNKDSNFRPRKKSNIKEKFSSEIFEGQILISAKGDGYIRTEKFAEDIKIPTSDLNTALNRDIVQFSISNKKSEGRIKGSVKSIIRRNREQFVGTILNDNGIISFQPDDRKIYKAIFILPNEETKNIKSNQKVLVKIKDWINLQGEVTKVLGEKGDHNTEMESIIYEKGFVPSFPPEVEKEAEIIKKNAKADFEEEVRRRISRPDGPISSWDFRNTTTFTIDPFDAKDFDDALSFKDLGDGTYEVGIHIADVSHYVREGSPIDQEAVKRATSIYLVDRTIPMLPEVLSNDLCSLNPNEDKLAFSAIFILNDKCEVLNRWFGETIINSDKRFNYIEAQEILNKGEGLFYNELNSLNKMALIKRKRRTKNGAISFGGSEVKFKLDEKGFPIEIYEKETLETNELIEDFMLLANREVTEYVNRLGKNKPFVYRIHDKPKPDAIKELTEYLKKIGYSLKTDGNGNVDSQDLNDLLDEIRGTDEEDLIAKVVVRSMAKAIYSTKNIGHYGLAFKFYTHFTSPIRRYPDVMVHRLLKRYLAGEEVSEKEIGRFEELSAISTTQEISAMEAERDSVKYKYAEYMSKLVGEEFEGMITSVVDWGVYVQDQKTKAEGLVSVRTLKDDHYNIDPKNYRIVGERSGKKYTLGDKVKIKLIGVDLEKRTIDFEIVN
ncbi:ribonuclease R [Candidatus Campbellbacteria bacterium RIFCSPLOWO2_01_FULL_34_15]|uniref:Ribonuclease R n=2 Tax=Candidatus Campbelliibacteriota TaxID=1752727 RepID=A0A1F5EPM9_9BACT|nr:MAG: ribonuclease R [Candidatus Campbellbacteria bacterium RIFCSPHIGHO2_01_FULL_34_10]OGD69343.1 MAG: ribonuclease R [Candidatus Campbellbacteria bacterium RIFCSPLOWO2_01_FULL_34_15]